MSGSTSCPTARLTLWKRWHSWHNLCEAALSEIKAHLLGHRTEAPLYDGPRARTTLERWYQIHDLLDQGVGLLECGRRLQPALHTIKRYARAVRPERTLRVPKCRTSLVGPYREHLRKRRADDPAVPVQHLFEEIKALGFTGCLNLPHKHINQGRAPRPPDPAHRRLNAWPHILIEFAAQDTRSDARKQARGTGRRPPHRHNGLNRRRMRARRPRARPPAHRVSRRT